MKTVEFLATCEFGTGDDIASHHGSGDEILAHIAPIAFRHINFQGIYRFPLARYLDRLLPSVPQKVAAGAK